MKTVAVERIQKLNSVLSNPAGVIAFKASIFELFLSN